LKKDEKGNNNEAGPQSLRDAYTARAENNFSEKQSQYEEEEGHSQDSDERQEFNQTTSEDITARLFKRAKN